MELNKKYIAKITYFILFGILTTSCNNESSSCYKIEKLNISYETPRRSPVYYKIQDAKTIKKIISKHIVNDYYSHNINIAYFIKNEDTVSKSEILKLKKYSGGIYLLHPTARFHKFYDSIKVINEIKKEKIILELKNGDSIYLNYCEEW